MSSDITIPPSGELLYAAGLMLVEQGLVSRTWGNISCRLDNDWFLITPSGRVYERVTPEEMVKTNIKNLCHDGGIKPSSEKGLHAEIYKDRPEINAVIHTHQLNASVCATVPREIQITDAVNQDLIGNSVRVATYALPGTKKLSQATTTAITGRRAALMANHGAVCIGEDMETAFKVAMSLETICQDWIASQYLLWVNQNTTFNEADLRQRYLDEMGKR